MSLNRQHAAELGQETVRILKTGFYMTAEGKTVEIGDLVRRAVKGTCSYPPNHPLPSSLNGVKETFFQVENETTLVAARRLVEEGYRPVALNFASAKNPGGGFLSGARAQEESLARSSGLYVCLVDNPMYDFHRAQPDPMYTHYAIYSPDVPVFRSDDGMLVDQPYVCSFITCPAVNAKVALERNPSRRSEISIVMWERILRVLAIAAEKRHEAIILGAWGCGVFGNEPREISELFRKALLEQFRGIFAVVVFAVLDTSAGTEIIDPFRNVFSTGLDRKGNNR
jgi:uncharacterized protein (TIGR02452 family)